MQRLAAAPHLQVQVALVVLVDPRLHTPRRLVARADLRHPVIAWHGWESWQ